MKNKVIFKIQVILSLGMILQLRNSYKLIVNHQKKRKNTYLTLNKLMKKILIVVTEKVPSRMSKNHVNKKLYKINSHQKGSMINN